MSSRLSSNKRLGPADCRDLIKLIGSHMRDNLSDFTRTTANTLIAMFVSKHPNSLVIYDADKQILSNGIKEYTIKLYDHVNFKKPTNCKTSRKRAAESQTEGTNDTVTYQAEKKYDQYGCVAYQVPYPDNENKITQEQKRKILLHTSEEHEIESLMEITYSSQRKDIIDRKGLLSDVLMNWPHLSDARFFLKHASTLFGKDVKDAWFSRMESDGLSLFSVLEIEAGRKNQVAAQRKEARQRMQATVEAANRASESLRERTPKLVSLFQLLPDYFLEDRDDILRCIPVNNSLCTFIS